MSQSKSVFQQISFYTFACILTQLITVLSALLMRNFLGPVQMGVWSVIQVLLIYSEYSILGMNNAISREIPFLVGANQKDKVENIKNTVYTFTLLSSGILATLIVVFALFSRTHLSQEFLFGLLLAALVIIFQRINNVMIEILRAFREFSLLSKQMLLSALVNFFLVAILSYNFKIYGFIIAVIFSLIFNIVFLFMNYSFRFKWHFKFGEIKQLCVYGLPLLAIAFLNSFFLSLDRWAIVKFQGIEDLGFYSVAIMSVTYLNSIPNSIGIVVAPNFQEKYGKDPQIEPLKEYLQKWCSAYRNLMPILIGLGWIWLPIVVKNLLSQFTEGIGAAQALILATFFLSQTNPYEYFLIAIKHQNKVFPVLLASISCSIVLLWVLLTQEWGIKGVGIAVTVASFFQWTLMMKTAGRLLYRGKEFYRDYFLTLGHFAYLIIVLAIIALFNMPTLLTTALLQSFVFSLLCLPLFFKLQKEQCFFSKMFSMGKRK